MIKEADCEYPTLPPFLAGLTGYLIRHHESSQILEQLSSERMHLTLPGARLPVKQQRMIGAWMRLVKIFGRGSVLTINPSLPGVTEWRALPDSPSCYLEEAAFQQEYPATFDLKPFQAVLSPLAFLHLRSVGPGKYYFRYPDLAQRMFWQAFYCSMELDGVPGRVTRAFLDDVARRNSLEHEFAYGGGRRDRSGLAGPKPKRGQFDCLIYAHGRSPNLWGKITTIMINHPEVTEAEAKPGDYVYYIDSTSHLQHAGRVHKNQGGEVLVQSKLGWTGPVSIGPVDLYSGAYGRIHRFYSQHPQPSTRNQES